MSLYNISTDSEHGCLTATWNTSNKSSSINKNYGYDLVSVIGGFDGLYSGVPVLFSNDRLLQNSAIISSDNTVASVENDPSLPIKDINLFLNPEVNKAIPSKGYNN